MFDDYDYKPTTPSKNVKEVIMAKNEFLEALGPLASLYLDPDVYEIMVDAYDKVVVDRKDRLVTAGVEFESPDALRTMIDRLMALGGIKLGLEKTSGHLRFPDASRCLAVIPPTAVDGPYLVIRKTRSGHFSMQDLLGFGSVTKEQYALLKSALQTRQNILIAGGFYLFYIILCPFVSVNPISMSFKLVPPFFRYSLHIVFLALIITSN